MESLEFKEIILAYITLVGFISYFPQIVRMIKQRSSKNMSIITWLMWMGNAALYLLYLILSDVNKWLIASQVLEVVLIALTLITVLFFRVYRKSKDEKVIKEVV